MISGTRILFIASSWNPDSFFRANCLRQLLYEVNVLDMHPEDMDYRWTTLMWRGLNWASRKLDRALDHSDINAQISDALIENSYDLVWIEKGLSVKVSTLERIKQKNKNIKIIGYSADDLVNPDNSTRAFRKSLGQYDHYFTTKSYNVDELLGAGCPSVSFIGNAYEPSLHYPINLEGSGYSTPVGFVGAYESHRARSMDYLARNIKDQVKVFGPRWSRFKQKKQSNLLIENTYLEGLEYAKAICSTQINLGFLHKGNRDLQTTRSVEIPACGAFLLAERTEEHKALFKEDLEAVYFNSDDELVDKVRYYLDHESERNKIAAQGYNRCMESGYSNFDRVKEMMEKVRSI